MIKGKIMGVAFIVTLVIFFYSIMYRTYVVSSDINKYCPLWFNLDAIDHRVQWEWPEQQDPRTYDNLMWADQFDREFTFDPMQLNTFFGDLNRVNPRLAEEKLAEDLVKTMIGLSGRPEENTYWYTALKPAGIPYSNFANSLKGNMIDRNKLWRTLLVMYTRMQLNETELINKFYEWPADRKYPPEKRGDIKSDENKNYYWNKALIVLELTEPENGFKVRQHRDTLYAKTVKGQNKVFNTFFPGVPDWYIDQNTRYFKISWTEELYLNGENWYWVRSDSYADYRVAWAYKLRECSYYVDMKGNEDIFEVEEEQYVPPTSVPPPSDYYWGTHYIGAAGDHGTIPRQYKIGY